MIYSHFPSRVNPCHRNDQNSALLFLVSLSRYSACCKAKALLSPERWSSSPREMEISISGEWLLHNNGGSNVSECDLTLVLHPQREKKKVQRERRLLNPEENRPTLFSVLPRSVADSYVNWMVGSRESDSRRLIHFQALSEKKQLSSTCSRLVHCIG